MTSSLWSRTRGGSSGARIFAAYVALVLVVAVAGPGLTVYAGEGNAGDRAPHEEVPAEVPEMPVVPVPAVDVAPVEVPDVAPAAEPVVEAPVVASVETPAATVVGAAVVAATQPMPSPDDSSWICAGGVKLDSNPRTGTYTASTANTVETPTTPADYSITITTYAGPDGAMLMDFTSNYPVSQVKVKGGNDAQFFNYSPAVYSATGLHAPVNASGKYADISHIVFCFGEIVQPQTGDLEVFKYRDANENGEYDDGEEMLEGWEMTLYDSGDNELESKSTDVNGKATFGALAPGTYAVTETMKPGWTNVTGVSQEVAVVAGQTASLWFGNVETESPPETGDLEIYKFEDDNENGMHDPGEAMLANWEFTVALESDPSVGGLSAASAAMVVVETGLTDEGGEYVVTGLLPDTYTVTETLKPGWSNVTPLSQEVDVVAGQTAEVWFGNIPDEEEPESGDLIVHKYNDLNRNGSFDEGEPMLGDWEFTLTREVDEQIERIVPSAIALIGSGSTDEFGELHFGGLVPGEYTVTETPQEGWDNITPLVQVVQVVVGETAEVWFGNAEEFLPFTWLDLAITKVADKESAAEGELITYKLTYWNNGNIPAESFTIVDDFDERYVSVVNANGGVVAGGKITWTIAGPLAQEAGKQTLTYTVRVSSEMPAGATNVDNTVVISHPRDEDPSNNTAKERVVVRVSEPFLPFTGGEFALLLGFAAVVGAFGLLLRLRADSAA